MCEINDLNSFIVFLFVCSYIITSYHIIVHWPFYFDCQQRSQNCMNAIEKLSTIPWLSRIGLFIHPISLDTENIQTILDILVLHLIVIVSTSNTLWIKMCMMLIAASYLFNFCVNLDVQIMTPNLNFQIPIFAI